MSMTYYVPPTELTFCGRADRGAQRRVLHVRWSGVLIQIVLSWTRCIFRQVKAYSWFPSKGREENRYPQLLEKDMTLRYFIS